MRTSNLTATNRADLEPKIAQQAAEVVFNGNGLFLQELAGGQQRPALLARQGLHMHRAKQVDPHHLRNAAGVIAVGLVHLRLKESLGVAGLDADHRQAGPGRAFEQPLRQGAGFKPNALKPPVGILEDPCQIPLDGSPPLSRGKTGCFVDDAHCGLFH